MIERKIGEIFFDGNVSLQVKLSEDLLSCSGCYYNQNGCIRNRDAAGPCTGRLRTDNHYVIFKEIQL